MKIKILASLFLLASAGCSTFSSGRSPSSSQEVLQGTFFKLNTVLSLGPEFKTKLKAFRAAEPGRAEEIAKGVKGAHRIARVTGLMFCKEKGFESIGAVFWAGRTLTGVHCISDAVEREGTLSDSYGVGCRTLGYDNKDKLNKNALSCVSASEETQYTRYDKIVDLTPNAEFEEGDTQADGLE